MIKSRKSPKFAPIVSDDRRIEVLTEGRETQIRMSSWVDGLGWSVQKTISLDSALVDDLYLLLGAARLRNKSAITGAEAEGSAKILDFPKYV